MFREAGIALKQTWSDFPMSWTSPTHAYISLGDIELTVSVKTADPLIIMDFFYFYLFFQLIWVTGLPCERWRTCNAGTEVHAAACYRLLLLELQGNGWAVGLALAWGDANWREHGKLLDMAWEIAGHNR